MVPMPVGPNDRFNAVQRYVVFNQDFSDIFGGGDLPAKLKDWIDN
jgi:hypothetical protein